MGDAMSYEYKVIPAPGRGLKAKGLKTVEDRFANALETEINALAAKGWEYVRADTLPCEQREGLMGKTTVYQNMLVFRRAKAGAQVAMPTPSLSAPQPKSGEERLAEMRTKTVQKPLVAKKAEPKADPDTDPDVAAE